MWGWATFGLSNTVPFLTLSCFHNAEDAARQERIEKPRTRLMVSRLIVTMRLIMSLSKKQQKRKSMVNPYCPSSNAMPNMSASSSVILTRYWVISGRIRPSSYSSSCPHFHLSIQLVVAPAIIIRWGDFVAFALRLSLTFLCLTIVWRESKTCVFRFCGIVSILNSSGNLSLRNAYCVCTAFWDETVSL